MAISGTYACVADNASGLQILPTQCEDPSGVGSGVDLASPMLLQVLPNPSSDQIVIRLEVRCSRVVQASIYDASGRRVRVLPDGILGVGVYDLLWDGRDEDGRMVAAGTYLVRATTIEGTRTARLVLLR